MSNVKSIWPAWKIATCFVLSFLIAAAPLFIFGQGWTGEVVILLEHLMKNQNSTLHYLASAYLDPENAMATDPTRILHALPIALALWTPWPDRLLDAALFITWIGTGMSVWKLALLLFPANRTGAFIAGMITTLTAYDASELIVSYYPHLLSVLIFLLALILLIKWWSNGHSFLLVFSCILLSISLMIYGLAAPSIPFALILLMTLSLVDNKPLKLEFQRLALAIIFWGVPLAIYATVLFRHSSSIPKGTSTAAAVSFPFTLDQLIVCFRMVLYNFNPFGWLDAYPFFWVSTMTYSYWVMIATAAVATIWGVFAVAVLDNGYMAESPHLFEWRRFLFLGAVLFSMLVASNISFSNLVMAESMFRTHLVSQVPAAILTGYLLSTLWHSNRILRLAGITLTIAIFFCGALSVAARSHHLVSTWKLHRTELRSLADNVTYIPNDMNIIIYNPPGTPYSATEVSWLARGWLGIIRGVVQSQDHFSLWSPGVEAICEPDGEKLFCFGNGQPLVQYDVSNLVILSYSAVDSKYHILDGNDGELPLSTNYTPRKHLLDSPYPLPELAIKIIGS
jgi:hypothetical protein